MGVRKPYVSEAVVAGAVLPIAILFLPLSVFFHFHYCEWNAPWNSNRAQLSARSKVIPFIHARETCQYQTQDGTIEYDIAGAFCFGLLLPVAGLIGGTWTALIACDYLFRYSVASSLKIDPRTGRFFNTPPQRGFRRFQFSLLTLLVLTVFVAVVLKFALAFPRR